jgi:serine/threonine protein kinase
LFSSETVEDEEKRLLCLDAAMGLQVLHSCMIVHGDIKLENVLVFPDERRRFAAKYSDFGLALLGADEPIYRGTGIYNAPEVHRQELEARACGSWTGGRIKREDLPKCDVFSFGLLAFEILNGGRRYYNLADTARFRTSLISREDPCNLLEQALEFLHALEIVLKIPHQLGKICDDIFRQCLSPDPMARLPQGWNDILKRIGVDDTLLPQLPNISKPLLNIPSRHHSILEILQRAPNDFAGEDLVAELKFTVDTVPDQKTRAKASFELFIITAFGNFLSAENNEEDEPLDWLAKAALLEHKPSMYVGQRVFEACQVPVPPPLSRREHNPEGIIAELDASPSSQFYSAAVRVLWSKQLRASTMAHIKTLSANSQNTSIDLAYPFHSAVIAGDVERISDLVKTGYDINQITPEGLTPLHTACMLADIESTEALIKGGADASINDLDNVSPLHWLVMFKKGCISHIANLLIRASGDINSRMHDGAARFFDDLGLILGATPVWWATMCRNCETISVILSLGAQTSVDFFNDKNFWTFSPVEVALATVCPDTLDLLLGNQMIMESLSEGERRHCMYRIAGPTSNSVQRWIMHGSDYEDAYCALLGVLKRFDLTLPDHEHVKINRNTPLCSAAFRYNVPLARALIKDGADVNLVTQSDGTALTQAIIGSLCLSNNARLLRLIQLFSDNGLKFVPHPWDEVPSKDRFHTSLRGPYVGPLLHLAVKFGTAFSVTKFILQKAPDQVNLRWGSNGATATFFIASTHEGPLVRQVAELLINHGADLSIETNHEGGLSGWSCCLTPAVSAVDMQEWALLKLFLDNGSPLVFGTSGRHELTLVHQIVQQVMHAEYSSVVTEREVRVAPLVRFLGLLLKHSASRKANIVNRPDYRGHTALTLAVIWGLPECVLALLHHDAQVDVRFRDMDLLGIHKLCYSPPQSQPFVVPDEKYDRSTILYYEGKMINPGKRSEYLKRLDEIGLLLGLQARLSEADDPVDAPETSLPLVLPL